MQKKTVIGYRASQLVKNFSRNNQQKKPIQEQNLKLKSFKVAFTSRMLHTNRKLYREKQQAGDQAEIQIKISKIKLAQLVMPELRSTQKQLQASTKNCKKEDPVFDFRNSFKKRILSPKILKISVNSSRSNYKQRSFSANTNPKNKQLKNPQSNESLNSFQFTFGLHQKV